MFGVSTVFWRDVLAYDQVATATDPSVPIDLGHGGRDFQTTDEDYGRWRRALADRPNAGLHRYPRLDHLLMPGFGPSLPQEYSFPDNVDGGLVRDLAGWLHATARP